MKRKLLLTALAAVCTASCAIGLTACAHKHDFSEEWEKDATNHWHECTGKDCDEVEGTAAHTYGNWTVITTATQDREGERKRACTVCGYEQTETIDKLHKHDWDEWKVTTPATCTEAGEETRVCKTDSTHKETRPANALGHDWNDWTVVKPSLTEEGKATRTCKHDITEKEEKILPKLNNEDYTVNSTASTCGEAGTAVYSYDKDGIKFSVTVEGDKLQHLWGNWTVTEANKPTATAEGKATRTCTRTDCDGVQELILPALTDNGYTITNNTAKCYETGTGTYSYAKDGHTVSFTAATPKTAHDLDEGTLTPATIDADAIITYTCRNEGCDHTEESVQAGTKLEALNYTVTVTGAPAGVIVKLGKYSAETNAQGVATVRAEKKDYDIIVENSNYSFTAGKVTAANPAATVAPPTRINASRVSGTYYNATEAITADGLYYFEIASRTDTFITLKNTTGTTKKYTVTLLDAESVYAKDGDLENLVSEPFEVYIIGADTAERSAPAAIITKEAAQGIAVIKVTSEDYADGTVHTPIPVNVDGQITLTAETLYYSVVTEAKALVKFVGDGSTVVWYGNDMGGDGVSASGNYFVNESNSYYFTATGTGTLTVAREYLDGENKPHAITITKGTPVQTELGALGGITDNVRWFKFTGVNTNTGYLTLASENVSYVVYEDSIVIANEDISVLPVAVTAGTEYFVRVLYKGQYEEGTNTATLTLALRDYKDTDALAVDNGQNKENPYALQVDTQDETYSNRKNGEVTFSWGSATNNVRYLVFTAIEEGELQFTGIRGGNVSLYTDAAFTTALAGDKYTKVGSMNGDICTTYMNAGETVYIQITGVTARNVKATLSYTKAVPVDYTVVVKDSADNLVNGVSVELWNTDGKVGEAVTTNAQGEAVFSQITAGEYTIKIVSDDYAYDKEVTIAKSFVNCTTEVSVTALVAYTVMLELPEGVEASVFDGVTATLKGTEATGTLQNGTVTFTQKVKPGVYQIIIEKDGYIVKGSTKNNEISVTAVVEINNSLENEPLVGEIYNTLGGTTWKFTVASTAEYTITFNADGTGTIEKHDITWSSMGWEGMDGSTTYTFIYRCRDNAGNYNLAFERKGEGVTDATNGGAGFNEIGVGETIGVDKDNDFSYINNGSTVSADGTALSLNFSSGTKTFEKQS